MTSSSDGVMDPATSCWQSSSTSVPSGLTRLTYRSVTNVWVRPSRVTEKLPMLSTPELGGTVMTEDTGLSMSKSGMSMEAPPLV